MLARVREFAGHAGEIALVHRAAANLLVQVDQRRALLGQHQDAGGLAIEPVHQFQELGLGPGPAQLLDHTEGHARAAVHGHAGRLVDHQQLGVLKQHREFARWHMLGIVRLRRIRHPHWRNAHDITRLQAISGIDPALIDANFTRTQHPVDMALGHALGHLQQEVVNALTFRAFVNRDIRHLWAGRRSFGSLFNLMA
jgi:hypothetical protein